MSLAFPTGKTRTAPCGCGTPVEEREDRIVPPDVLHWTKPRHDAPCGLPCMNGGVDAKVYRTGQIHRVDGKCPRCAP